MGEIYTIPPHRSFVDLLARGLLDEAGGSPVGLIDGLVLLPTRRACRTLRDAFLRQSAGRALTLPRIQPIGEVEPEELMPAGAPDADLPPAIGRVRRQLLLARLLAGYDPRMPVEHRLRLADELAFLLDELASERCSLKALASLVPDHLAEHWQASRTLLDLIDRHWPSILASNGALDPAERRNLLLDGLARRLEAERPERRIVAAGSTGSIDATRGLLRAILALPRGAVVLPGLDLDADDALWREVGPAHPQGGLKQLLKALGRPRTAVRLWPAADVGPGVDRAARTALLRTALRPAGLDGPGAGTRDLVEAGRPGLEVLVVADLALEAGALALRMRAVLEEPGRTAMLVTPDRDLARRVAIELRRWQVEVDDSAGVPLDRTPEGALLLLVAGLLGGVRPATLLALLKHPLVRLGRPPGEIRHEARRLERAVLRGPRISGGFAGILTELRRVQEDVLERHPERGEIHARSIELVERLERAAAPFLELAGLGTVDLVELIRAHLALIQEVTAPPAGGSDLFWSHEAGEAAAELFREILDGARDGHPVAPNAYPALLAQLMTARPVRARVPRHPRLAIFGQLEARLLHADLVLIGGLNEGVWPAAVDPGPWLNRAMREKIGLQPVERRIGLAAHDFEQLAAAPEVVLSRAERDARGNPTVPSRWLVRLQTLLDAGADEAGPGSRSGWWGEWAAMLDRPAGPPAPVDQPRPTPPLAARPRELSVSDVGLWMRDPYALYAKRVLKLRALAPLEQEPGALERGVMIHEVLEAFVRQFPDDLPADALGRLLHLGRQAFQAYTHRPLVRRLWWPRFEQAARWYLDQERERRPTLAGLMVEVEGELPLEARGGRFLLKARADRIERAPDGRLTVIDYKTGAPPKDAEVTSGRQPQLPLEALMAGRGAFRDIGPAEVAALWFWSIRGDASGGETRALKQDPVRLAGSAAEGLMLLIEHYDDDAVGYPARLRPDMSFPRDYDHLARFKEWAG